MLGQLHKRRAHAEDRFATLAIELQRNLETLLISAAAHVAVVESGGVVVAFATSGSGLEDGTIAELEDMYVVPTAAALQPRPDARQRRAAWARSIGCHRPEVVVAPNGQIRRSTRPR